MLQPWLYWISLLCLTALMGACAVHVVYCVDVRMQHGTQECANTYDTRDPNCHKTHLHRLTPAESQYRSFK